MKSGLILAIDQGTTNTKALLVDRRGLPVFRTAAAVPLKITPDGFVEQDPLLLWDSVLKVIGAATNHAGQLDAKIEAIAISNQRETAVAWSEETGRPVANAVSWQCSRSADICDRVAHSAGMIREKTGLPLAPLISASKWMWLLENVPAIVRASRNGVLRLGNVDSWLIFCLTGGDVNVTDLTNASRTGLLNLNTLWWDQELLRLFNIAEFVLPALRPSGGPFGVCSGVPELEGVPILAAIGDSHAAMFGHGRHSTEWVKATYGTGSSLMALTPALVHDTPSLARTIAWSYAGRTQFALEGNINMTGSAVQWLGEFLHLSDPAQDVASLAASVVDAGGLYFVPAMVGLGAPHWKPSARGLIAGLSRNHTSGHLARAAIDAIAYQVADVFLAMQSVTGTEFRELLADGGATRNDQLMQFQSDVIGKPVMRSRCEELSAIGSGWLAGMSLGWWTAEEIESFASDSDCFEPKLSIENRKTLYDGWSNVIACAGNGWGVG